MEKQNQCTEIARITLPWANKILNYCPVHANKIVWLGNQIGNNIQVQLISPISNIQCEATEPLTEEEVELSKTFNI